MSCILLRGFESHFMHFLIIFFIIINYYNKIVYYIYMKTLFQKNLLILIIFTQIILWGSYLWIIPRNKTSLFWGRIKKKYWKEFLFFASIAYILNMMLYLYFCCKGNINDKIIFGVTITLLVYYGLQMFFLPITLTKNRLLIKILLGVCVIPLLYLAYFAYQESTKIKNIYEKWFLIITGILPLLHVFINDFIRFGFTF